MCQVTQVCVLKLKKKKQTNKQLPFLFVSFFVSFFLSFVANKTNKK